MHFVYSSSHFIYLVPLIHATSNWKTGTWSHHLSTFGVALIGPLSTGKLLKSIVISRKNMMCMWMEKKWRIILWRRIMSVIRIAVAYMSLGMFWAYLMVFQMIMVPMHLRKVQLAMPRSGEVDGIFWLWERNGIGKWVTTWWTWGLVCWYGVINSLEICIGYNYQNDEIISGKILKSLKLNIKKSLLTKMMYKAVLFLPLIFSL